MTYGEKLLSMSTLPSGNSARYHFLNISKPDSVYLDGERLVYVDSSKDINGDIVVLQSAADVDEQVLDGIVVDTAVAGGIILSDIDGEIEGEE